MLGHLAGDNLYVAITKRGSFYVMLGMCGFDSEDYFGPTTLVDGDWSTVCHLPILGIETPVRSARQFKTTENTKDA